MTDFLDIATPVAADPETLERLADMFDDAADSRDIAAAAIEAGVDAPDERDGWTIVGAFDPDGNGPTLYWIHPEDRQSYPSD